MGSLEKHTEKAESAALLLLLCHPFNGYNDRLLLLLLPANPYLRHHRSALNPENSKLADIQIQAHRMCVNSTFREGFKHKFRPATAAPTTAAVKPIVTKILSGKIVLDAAKVACVLKGMDQKIHNFLAFTAM